MSWAAAPYDGPAEGYQFEFQTDPSTLNARSQCVAQEVAIAIEAIIGELGGERVYVSAGGHQNDEPGHGESVYINIASPES